MTALPPPAWYPDPSGRFEHRYWDGSTWTDRAARAGEVVIDPLAFAPRPEAAAPVQTRPEPVELPAAATIVCFADRLFPATGYRKGNVFRQQPMFSLEKAMTLAWSVEICRLQEGGALRLDVVPRRIGGDEAVARVDDLARFEQVRARSDQPVARFLDRVREQSVGDDGAVRPDGVRLSDAVVRIYEDSGDAFWWAAVELGDALVRSGVLIEMPRDPERKWEPVRDPDRAALAALEPRFSALMTGWEAVRGTRPALAGAVEREVHRGLKKTYPSEYG